MIPIITQDSGITPDINRLILGENKYDFELFLKIGVENIADIKV
jgi:hypothetical protein